MLKCPVYRNERCLLKFIFTQDFNSKVFQLPVENFNNDCQGEISSCSFQHKEIAEQSAPKEEAVETPVEPVAPVETQVAPVEEAPKKTTVTRIQISGKQYLKSSANILYDPSTKEEVGLWNPVTKKIEELPEEEEEEEEEEEYL